MQIAQEGDVNSATAARPADKSRHAVAILTVKLAGVVIISFIPFVLSIRCAIR
jgi:hypothetical protein